MRNVKSILCQQHAAALVHANAPMFYMLITTSGQGVGCRVQYHRMCLHGMVTRAWQNPVHVRMRSKPVSGMSHAACTRDGRESLVADHKSTDARSATTIYEALTAVIARKSWIAVTGGATSLEGKHCVRTKFRLASKSGFAVYIVSRTRLISR